MKLLIFLCIFASTGYIMARPQDGGSSEESDDPYAMLAVSSCLVENWREEVEEETNILRVNNCVKCIDEIGDPTSEAGVPAAKKCLSSFLPNIDTACSTEIAAVAVGEEETLLPVLECMKTSVKYMLSSWCLSKSNSENTLDKFTDGAVCMMEAGKNITMYHHYLKHQGEDHSDHSEEHHGEGEGNKKKVMAIFVQAYCDAANDGQGYEDCKACFQSAGEDVQQVSECSSSFLSSKFQVCQAGLDALASNPNPPKEEKGRWIGVHKCYVKELTRYVMTDCAGGAVEATPQGLLDGMTCGKETAVSWLHDNVGEKIANKVEKMLN